MNYLRAGIRIPVELPAQVRWKDRAGKHRQAEGMTACISGNGLFLAVPVRLRHETPIKVTVKLPSNLTRTPVEIECRGRVVRQSGASTMPGFGAIIDDYRFRVPSRPA
jgi:hypothetical protein